MSEVTSAPTGAPSPRTVVFRSTASDGHRVVYHEPICPDCGSFAGCRKRSHWNGRYCPLCVGRIVISARRVALGR